MVGSSERNSCGTSLLYPAAALLACNLALAQPEITVVDRASIKAEHLETPSTFTHRLNLSMVHLEDSGWQAVPALNALRQATAIFSQCDIGIVGVEWVSLSVPSRFLYFSTPAGRELARLHPVRKPAIYLVLDMQDGVYDAEAIGRENSPTRPEIADTVWIRAAARDPGIVLAHELAHVLMDSGEHSDEPGNLMHDQTSGANTKLSVTQCARMRKRASENGLLQR
jgi:hypothetical protein